MRHRPRACGIGHPETFVHEQHLIGPRGKRWHPGRATVVVEVEIRDVEEAFQLSHHVERVWLVRTVKLANVPTTNVVLLALVIVGGGLFTNNVNVCVASGATPLVAVTVSE